MLINFGMHHDFSTQVSGREQVSNFKSMCHFLDAQSMLMDVLDFIMAGVQKI